MNPHLQLEAIILICFVDSFRRPTSAKEEINFLAREVFKKPDGREGEEGQAQDDSDCRGAQTHREDTGA